MPYLVRLQLAWRLAKWHARLDRLGVYLAAALPPEPAAKRQAGKRKA